MTPPVLQALARRAAHARDVWVPYIRRAALVAGLLPGHTDYTRFIILGRSRSGSNFLRSLLNAHSQVTVFGEIFQSARGQDVRSIAWALPGYSQSARVLALFRSDPARFLETQVFHRFPPSTRAVGFKIFYYHAHEPAWEPAWTYLRAHREIHVIHIRRRNILETHLSRKRAILSDQWVKTSRHDPDAPLPPILLDYEECLADFVQTRAWETEYDRLFADHPKIEVVYEDLAADYRAEIARVQAFLEVDPEPVAPQTFKQSRQLLSQSIANYAELKARFQGTPWAEFFTE